MRTGSVSKSLTYSDSSSVAVKNVEVKLTEIIPLPYELEGKLALNLHYMHDNTHPYKRFEDINPGDRKFIDVVQWIWDRKDDPYYCIYASNENIDTRFPVYETKFAHKNGGGEYDFINERVGEMNYIIKIEVTAENSKSVCKKFCFGLKNKKLYLWSVD
jgi:hypothetical protein